MVLRSAIISAGLILFSIVLPGCAEKHPPEHGLVIAKYDDPTPPALRSAPADGKYACYKDGVSIPLATVTLTKGEKLGFVIVQSPQEHAGTIPLLYGVAGKEKILLPREDKYAWKQE